jgi:monofunctional biosynthetic peptidoglycan transglycosylase
MFKSIKLLIKTSILFFFVYTFQWVLFYKFINPIVTPLMMIRTIEGAIQGKWVPIQKRWVHPDEMPSAMYISVMAAEDGKFRSHWGFDIEAIKKAMNYNRKNKGKRPTRGASTISQQTAKNVFLWPGRDWIRKGLETYFTVLIELLWSKDRILEVYVNVIEFGIGQYGIGAAAPYYFNKSASELNKDECARLAAILPLPLKWSPVHPNARVQNKIFAIKRNYSTIEALEKKD